MARTNETSSRPRSTNSRQSQINSESQGSKSLDEQSGALAGHLIFIVSGPGGVGKGTVVRELVAQDRRLWLSRSWTTRSRRDGEAADAYEFVSPETFRKRIDEKGFLEWVEFLGSSYGTPIPNPPAGCDVLLEIELQGAQLVREKYPEAIVILLVPPSVEVQRERLAKRGDSAERIEARVVKGELEMRQGRKIADHIVINDDLDTAVAAIADIVSKSRAAAKSADGPNFSN